MLRIRTLGAIEVTALEAEGPAAASLQPKHLALLVYLAVQARSGLQRRDRLTATFWPELDAAHARAALRKALHHIRACVGPGVLLTVGDDVRIDPAQCWCDAREMRDLAATGALEESVALFRGEFLDGFHIADAQEFESWLERERLELRTLAADGAFSLAMSARAAGEREAAVHLARRAVALAPLESRPTHLLLELLDAIGDRPAALAHYRRFARRLHEELEVRPDEATRRLVAAWRGAADVEAAADETAGPAIRGPAPVPSAPHVGDREPPPRSEATALAGSPVRVGGPRRRATLIGVAATALVSLASLALVTDAVPDALAPVVVADVAGSAAPDDRVVAQSLLAGALEQEGRLTPLGADELRRGLRMMGRPDSTTIDEALARELAFRGGIRHAVAATLDVSGTSYAVSARIVDGESGRVVATARETAATRDALIAASGRLAARLAGQLGRANERGDLEVPGRRYDASTASFEAFRLWVLGARETRRGQFASAERLLRAAIAQDSGFVNAWVSLANVLNGTYQRDSSLAVIDRLDRIADRDPSDARRRRWITALARSRYPEALAVADEVLALDASTPGYWNNRAIVLAAMGRDEEAIRAEQSAVAAARFGPNALHLVNLAGFTAAAGRPAAARAALDSARRRCGSPCDVPLVVGVLDDLDLIGDDWESVAAAADARRVPIARSSLQMRRGAARAAWEALADARARGNPHWNAELAVALVASHAVVAPSAPSRGDLVADLQWRGTWAALHGDTAEARRHASRLDSLLPQAYRGAAPEFIVALIARRAGRPREVITGLGQVARTREYGRPQQDAQVGPVAIHWVLAEAYERVGRVDSAIVMYDRVLQPRDAMTHLLAIRGLVWSHAHGRLAELHLRNGDRAAASRHARAFLQAFTEPDPELRSLRERVAAVDATFARP